MKPGSGWERKFEDPILLPGGRKLVTLRDAAAYITSLPKKESDLPEWQTAIEALLLVSRGGPTMMARIGVMKALNRHVERVFNPSAKRHIGGSGSSRETNDHRWAICLLVVPELTSATNIKLNTRVSLRPIRTSLAWLQSRRWLTVSACVLRD